MKIEFKQKIQLLLVLIITLTTCKKEDPYIEWLKNKNKTSQIKRDYPSPCSSTLSDNRIAFDPQIFSDDTVNVTASLNSTKTAIEVNPVGGVSGDIDIYFHDMIAPGEYILDFPLPESGKAHISMTPIYCGACPYQSGTSGKLYVTETDSSYIIEFCEAKLYNKNINYTLATGKVITSK